MAKLVLNPLVSLENQTSAVQTLNANFQAIVTAIENTLSRDGTTPNSMSGAFDMNSNRVLNLPEPVGDTEPVRLMDIGGLTGLDIANLSEVAAQVSADADSAAASAAEAASYVGAAIQAPKWSTARQITVSGAISGVSPFWDGSTDLNWTGLTITPGAVTASHLASGAAVTNLGFTPANLAGATFTGDVRLNFTATSLSADSVGYRGIPVNSQPNTYNFTINDCGRLVRHSGGTGHNWVINVNSTTPYPVGAAIVVRNVGSGAVTLARDVGVSLRISGSATDQNVTLAQWGLATLIQEDTNVWVVTGSGLT